MRNILRVLMVPLLVFAQVAFEVPFTATASVAPAGAAEGTNTNIVIALSTTEPDALAVQSASGKPNFDTEVLAPLRAAQQAKAEAEAKAQAEARAAAKAAAAKKAAASVKLVSAPKAAPLIGPATGDNWYRLRMCEAGNDYTRNSGNGYYGAYQYNLSTWANYGGYTRPDLAPPEVQDAKAIETHARRGWTPWPACARKLGLM